MGLRYRPVLRPLCPLGKSLQRPENVTSNHLGSVLNRRLPNPQHCPAGVLELSSLALVAAPVCLDLADPIRSVDASGELPPSAAPVLAVPEVSVAKDDEARSGKDDVGSAG